MGRAKDAADSFLPETPPPPTPKRSLSGSEADFDWCIAIRWWGEIAGEVTGGVLLAEKAD